MPWGRWNCLEAPGWVWPGLDAECVGVGEGLGPRTGGHVPGGNLSPRGPRSSLPAGLDFRGTAVPFPAQK